MSILIKNMEMPKTCVFCELYDGDLHWCRGAKKEVPYSPEDKRAKFCPLVPVPPHGRLIDADALDKVLGRLWDCCDDDEFANKQVWKALENAPTILESTMGQVFQNPAVNETEDSE